MINLTPHIVKNNIPSFRSSKEEKAPEQPSNKQQYNDPLMQWPARGLAYSNELGAAISEVAPKLGLALWIPAFLYFGADIYDKYKNDKASYDPNAKRGTEQAIFQLLASVLLPTAAVKLGQKGASVAAIAGKDGLSLQCKEEVTNFLQEFISRRNLSEYQDYIPQFKKEFFEQLENKRQNLTRENKIENPIKSVFKYIFNRRHPESMAKSQKDKVTVYADKCIDKIFEIHKDLVANNKPKDISSKLFTRYQKLKNTYKADKDKTISGRYIENAADDIIKIFEKKRMMNPKILKTIGGFVALGLAIKPIDIFVEKVIMKKYVEPNLSMLDNSQVKSYKEKVLT